ncbi:MAG: hypothetical protein RSC92_05710, partial [Clostridia bacterium]
MKYLKRYADLISYDLDLEIIKTLESHVGYCIKEDLVKYNVNKISEPVEPELPSNADETIVVIKTTEANEEVIFQFWDNTEQSIVNWGDGSIENLKHHTYDASLGHTDDYIRHSYVEPGEYTVILKGDNVTSHWLYFNLENIDEEPFTDLDGTNIDMENHSIFKAFPTQTYKAIQLGNHIKSFNALLMFKDFLYEIDKDLFKYCYKNVESLINTFAMCSQLSIIGEGLFDKCTNLKNVNCCFMYCGSISHPYNLTSSNLPTIWEVLNKNCISMFAEGTSEIFYSNMPDYAGGLIYTGDIISSIVLNVPENTTISDLIIFCTNKVIIDWGDGTLNFGKYSENNHTYKNAGKYRININGGTFQLLNTGYVEKIIQIRNNCTRMKFANSILKELEPGCLDNFTNEIKFDYFLSNCSLLTSIPKGLFDNCTNVTDFSYCFYDCSALTTIPEGLFDNCTNVTDFSSCFARCISLNSIPAKLFDNCTKVT